MEGETIFRGKCLRGVPFQRHVDSIALTLTSNKAMFDTLEADIVAFQETKIQRKDLRDDMVLVPGWDCFFSLPRQKKGMNLPLIKCPRRC
jgi:hypothetical protein